MSTSQELEIQTIKHEMTKLRRDKIELQEALDFYADESNWDVTGVCSAVVLDVNGEPDFIEDKGYVARKVLKQMDGKESNWII